MLTNFNCSQCVFRARRSTYPLLLHDVAHCVSCYAKATRMHTLNSLKAALSFSHVDVVTFDNILEVACSSL